MKNVKTVFFIYPIIILGLAAFIFGCSKEDGKLPEVTTSEVFDITNNSAKASGTVTSDGGSKIVALGLVWSTSENPTVSDFYSSVGQYTIDGIDLREFTSVMSNLEKNTFYYVRAYAANEVGVAYGQTVTFETDESGMIIHPLTADMILCWTQETSEGPKENLVDGNPATYWHSAWSSGVQPLPHYIQITFPEAKPMGGFTYTHRNPSGVAGRPTQFDLQTSNDLENWTTVWTSEPGLPVTPVDEAVTLLFGQNFSSRYFRIRILTNSGNTTFTYLSTITVFEMRN
jgi:hypothetical protein